MAKINEFSDDQMEHHGPIEINLIDDPVGLTFNNTCKINIKFYNSFV